MRQLTIQVLLIAGTLLISWRLLASYGQKAQALRRLGLIVFAAFAMWSILDPSVWSRLAQLVGIGRGADLILYGLVVAFFGFVVTTFRRFRDMETRYTRLARQIALGETLPPLQHPAVAGSAGSEPEPTHVAHRPAPTRADPSAHPAEPSQTTPPLETPETDETAQTAQTDETAQTPETQPIETPPTTSTTETKS